MGKLSGKGERGSEKNVCWLNVSFFFFFFFFFLFSFSFFLFFFFSFFFFLFLFLFFFFFFLFFFFFFFFFFFLFQSPLLELLLVLLVTTHLLKAHRFISLPSLLSLSPFLIPSLSLPLTPQGAYSSFSAPAPQVAPSIQPQGSMGHPPSGGGSFTGSMGHPPSGGGSSFSGSYPPSSSSCPPGQFPVQTPKHQVFFSMRIIIVIILKENNSEPNIIQKE